MEEWLRYHAYQLQAADSMDKFQEDAAFAGGHSQLAETATSDLEAYYKAMVEHLARERQAPSSSSESPAKKSRAE